MQKSYLSRFVCQLVAIAVCSLGLVQPSAADVIGTERLLENDQRQTQLSRLELLLTREDVATQLAAYGVEPDAVVERMQNLTTAELVSLEGQVDRHIAGGSAIGIIGAVFLVLLILELVGVTDVFKAL